MYVIIYLSYNIFEKVSEDGTGSRSPSKDVGDVGVPPHLTFSKIKWVS